MHRLLCAFTKSCFLSAGTKDAEEGYIYITLCKLGTCSFFSSSADFFENKLFFKKSFKNIIRVPNDWDPYQDRPDLDPICLHNCYLGKS